MFDSGQKCAVASCEAKGEPSRDVPGSAWCFEHEPLKLEERIALWQQRVQEQEERERNAAP